jgi:hypothetical protein
MLLIGLTKSHGLLSPWLKRQMPLELGHRLMLRLKLLHRLQRFE